MSSSYSSIADSSNYFVWPNATALAALYQSKDTIDALFVTDRSPAYLSSNCSCNGFQTFFTSATPETSFTFGAWRQYSVNGTQVVFDTNIDLSCSKTAKGDCILTLHDSDKKGYNQWGTPLATIGYLDISFDGNGLERSVGFPIAYSDPKPATYFYPPEPLAHTTSSSTHSSITSAASLASSTASTSIQQTTQSPTTAISSNSSASTASQSSHSKSTSKSLIIGVAVGVSFAFLLALVALLLFLRRRKSAKHQVPFTLGILRRKSVTHEKLTSEVALFKMHSSGSSPVAISPMRMGFIQQTGTPMMTPETLRDFIAAASLDSRTTMDPPAQLILPGDEPSALIHNIWDAIAVRETYVSRLNTSITIPSTLESLRKQATEIAYRTRADPPAMLAAISTPFKGDTIGWSESNRFKHTFAFSGGTHGVPKKRLVVRRDDSVNGGRGKKFQTHEKWAVGNCPDCQCFRGASEVVKAFMTVYVADGGEVEACKNCQPLVDNFKKLHSVKAVDQSATISEQEAKRAELARQAVEREWERMESEYGQREWEGKKGNI